MITFGFKNRFSGWIRAAIAVLIGCVMVIKPETSLIFLVKIIAAVMIASGLVTLAYGIANRREGGLTLLIFNTIVDIAIGVLLFIFPEVVASFVIILLGIVRCRIYHDSGSRHSGSGVRSIGAFRHVEDVTGHARVQDQISVIFR